MSRTLLGNEIIIVNKDEEVKISEKKLPNFESNMKTLKSYGKTNVASATFYVCFLKCIYLNPKAVPTGHASFKIHFCLKCLRFQLVAHRP